jgi:putative (di)nucleoside polyphosphate hydrolase
LTKSSSDNHAAAHEPHSVSSDELPADLAKLLEEPEVRLMMHADGVDADLLLRTLRSIAEAFRSQIEPPGQPPAAGNPVDDRFYRPGVGILLLNSRNEVFVGRRIDLEKEAWQMPQGGIDEGESARDAVFRELREEIGTGNAIVVAESKRWLYYDVPADAVGQRWKGRWRGQKQRWFVMLFKGQDDEIDVHTEHPEFSEWKWVSPSALPGIAASFKRRLYADVLGDFSEIFRD